MPDDAPTPVVTAFVVDPRGRVLLVRRAAEQEEYGGRWSGVSGRIEAGEAPVDAARREVAEETGLRPGQVAVEAVGDPLRVDDPDADRAFLVHPVRLAYDGPGDAVRLDRENDRCEWVEPGAIRERPTVPDLWETWLQVAP